MSYEFKRLSHKHYLFCLGCNKVLAINRCPLGNYEESLAKETNYIISGHKLDIYGYCPKCREKYAHKEETCVKKRQRHGWDQS
ncbi:transcriptional repressor [Caproicibacter fermentans]|uniref:Transcriptional repressor n=1 Tax=Caproicibacter fermentans TaxID=2576756 RepID=A0A7G8TG25_9FIRM|nr:transcriptional repressor [Caproicibacter fermentans]